MECEDVERWLPALVDGEVDAIRMVEIERHMGRCPACTARLAEQRQIQAILRSGLDYHKVPESLAERLKASVVAEQGGADVVPLRRPSRPVWLGHLLSAAAGVVLTIAVGSLYLERQGGAAGGDPIADQVLSSHLRALMVDHAVDVPSSDQHTVKPWFNGKVDVAPVVVDLAGQGFPLVGGRLDYLDGRPVAAMVYKHRAHTINLFALPGASTAAQAVKVRRERGYTLLNWAAGGVAYWAVSDLGADEMRDFQRGVEKGENGPQ